jgi:hypothetical protein
MESSCFHRLYSHELVKPGSIVTTHKPRQTLWSIFKVLSGIEYQRGKKEATENNPSYAALELTCQIFEHLGDNVRLSTVPVHKDVMRGR